MSEKTALEKRQLAIEKRLVDRAERFILLAEEAARKAGYNDIINDDAAKTMNAIATIALMISNIEAKNETN